MSPWGGIIISTETAGTCQGAPGRPTGDELTSVLDPEMINEVLEAMTDLAEERLR